MQTQIKISFYNKIERVTATIQENVEFVNGQGWAATYVGETDDELVYVEGNSHRDVVYNLMVLSNELIEIECEKVLEYFKYLVNTYKRIR